MKDIVKDNVYVVTAILIVALVAVMSVYNSIEDRFVTRSEYIGFKDKVSVENCYIKEQISDIKALQLSTQKDIKTLIRLTAERDNRD